MQEFSCHEKLMGSDFQLALVMENEKDAMELLQMGVNEIKRLEKLLSEFLPKSETTRINELAYQKFIKIDKECFQLIERSLAISQMTQGCFDISVSPLKKMYRFDNQEFKMPPPHLIKENLANVGYQKIKLNAENQSIYFSNKNLKISFAAIGKGYASDVVKKIWQREGVTSGYINASGDLNAFGKKVDGTPYKVGIANPENLSQMLFYVPLENASVATSGDYVQHFIYKGKKFSHNINPHTGLPLTGIKSVTVFSPSAELSDALATAIYVKGVKAGIGFANQLPQTHSVIVDENNKLFFTKNIKYEEVTI